MQPPEEMLALMIEVVSQIIKQESFDIAIIKSYLTHIFNVSFSVVIIPSLFHSEKISTCELLP